MPLRIALIGAGAMGRQHQAVIAAEPDTELCALADPGEAGRAFAADCGVPAFDDHRELLERVRPEAVIIANPNPHHVATARDCLNAGVPALIEKPVGIDLAEVSALIEAARHAATPLLVGHHRRHNPLIGRARELLADGVLGEMTNVTALWQLRKPADYFAASWRRTPGNGLLHTNLIHDLDLLRHLCGEIVEVQAMASDRRRGLPYADTAALLLRFANGALGTLNASDSASAPWSWELTSGENPVYPHQADQPCYLLSGTEGALALPGLTTWRYAATPHWHAPLERLETAAAPGAALARQLRHFIAVARGDAEPLIGVEDAGRTLALIDAVERAAASGRATTPHAPWET
ncbi:MULTISPECIES: Gfo/Idh/MocA family oxidoreductase [unclassified Modicisalibacter]|uniref:Gfo/Idh/MocA family protein n=1 Tax=unclassified Modicisalibacter TaxID=2679913 RepID=UPI001CCCBC94|nr:MULTISPECIES: Gfo/Idh/MocA family oxidoreductase [unclassified Modicisalibacter]MBZ9557789.1 Gfo/Idh/MocA family oxidoreductase [Modicisalibacter sp. R2A 31.J]MBZ9573546.1 Gfo/Idh/MocA family oxidoreductase [Modicisalibacter sp. MOD 31.J]